MPPTRRTRNSGGTAKGAQKTLSFASSKAPLPSSSKGKGKPSDAPASSILATPTTTITPAQAQDPSPTAALDPSSAAQDNPSLGHATSHLAVAQQGTSTITQLKNEQSPEEVRARKVTDAQIRRYWREREGERRAGRVHQGGLEVEERVLRLWDVSGQFGVCLFLFLSSSLFFCFSDSDSISRKPRLTLLFPLPFPYTIGKHADRHVTLPIARNRHSTHQAVAPRAQAGPRATHRGPGNPAARAGEE